MDDAGLAKNRDFLISTQTYAAKNKTVSNLLTQYLSADMTWANNHKAQLTTMMMKMLKLKKSIVQKMVDRRTYSFGKVSDSILAEQQSIADVFYQQGVVTKKVDVTDAVVK